MKCDEIRALLNPYVDGELSGAEAEQVKRHIGECPACAKEITGLNKVKGMLCKLPVRPAPDALLERVENALARPANEKQQTANLFWRYRWLAGSLTSAAAVVLVVFIVTTQPRKSDIDAPPPADGSAARYEEKAKANLEMDKPIATKADIADSLQPQPMLYTQQVNITARDVNAVIERVYYVASLDMAPGQADEKFIGKAGGAEKGRKRSKVTDDKDLLAKMQNRQAIVTNVGVPYREQRTQFEPSYSQRGERYGQHILKVTIPLSQKDEFIRQLKGNIPDKMVFAEIKAGPAGQVDGLMFDMLAEGKAPEAKKNQPESAKETGKAGDEYQYDKMARAGGKRNIAGKQSGDKKTESPKLAPPTLPASPGAPTPPPPQSTSRPAEELVQSSSEKKKEESKDAGTEKLETFGDIQNEVVSQTRVTTGQAAQVQQTTVLEADAELPDPTVEFIIIIEPEPPAAKEK